MTEGPLGDFPDDWERALAVMAHPDDMEYGGAAAVAAWTRAGKQVSYLLLTKGEAGIDSLPPDECARVRVEEQRASAAIVGVDDVEFLDHPDGTLEYGLTLRRDIAAAIRRHRPQLVLATNHRETYGGTHLNMADHRVAGQATIDAVRDAANRWVFPDLAEAGLDRVVGGEAPGGGGVAPRHPRRRRDRHVRRRRRLVARPRRLPPRVGRSRSRAVPARWRRGGGRALRGPVGRLVRAPGGLIRAAPPGAAVSPAR